MTSWIKFDEKDTNTWPDKDQEVLTWDGEKRRAAKFWYFQFENGMVAGASFQMLITNTKDPIDISIKSRFITHWQLLPEPPTED